MTQVSTIRSNHDNDFPAAENNMNELSAVVILLTCTEEYGIEDNELSDVAGAEVLTNFPRSYTYPPRGRICHTCGSSIMPASTPGAYLGIFLGSVAFESRLLALMETI